MLRTVPEQGGAFWVLHVSGERGWGAVVWCWVWSSGSFSLDLPTLAFVVERRKERMDRTGNGLSTSTSGQMEAVDLNLFLFSSSCAVCMYVC